MSILPSKIIPPIRDNDLLDLWAREVAPSSVATISRLAKRLGPNPSDNLLTSPSLSSRVQYSLIGRLSLFGAHIWAIAEGVSRVALGCFAFIGYAATIGYWKASKNLGLQQIHLGKTSLSIGVDCFLSIASPKKLKERLETNAHLLSEQMFLELKNKLNLWVNDSSGGKKAEAANLIITAYKKKNIDLSLSGLELETLPVGISKFLPDLKTLDLNRNNFRVIPEDLKGFLNLEVLHLDHNHLKSFSVSKGQFPSMRSLSLRFNQLHSLPMEVGSMRVCCITPVEQAA